MGKKERARNGQGWKSLRKDGRYDVGLPIWAATGTKWLRSTKRTEAEADAWLTEKRYERDRGLLLDFEADKLTVEAYLRRWLEYSVKHSVAPSTHYSYRWAVEKHIIPALGRVKLTKLTPAHLQGLYAETLNRGLAPTTVHNLHRTMRKAMKQAKKWRLVALDPTEDADPPSYRPKEMHPLSSEQALAFLKAAEGNRLEALWHLAVRTGMREGEILALRWSDVDFERGVVRVRRSVSFCPSLRFSEPKGGRGRAINVGERMVARFKAHRRRQNEARIRTQGARWHDLGLVFPSSAGSVLRRSTLMRHFHKLLKEAGCPRVRFHDLRHTAATLMLADGEHYKVVQEILGHASIKQTMDTYAHTSPTMHESAASRMDALFS